MKLSELKILLAELNFHPAKILGQNFMTDENFLEYIVRTASPEPGKPVLEIGPGFGALTRKLLSAGANVTAVEFDHRLCKYLEQELSGKNFSLISGDVCRVDFTDFITANPEFQVISNLPYSVSSIFVARMLELPTPPQAMFLVLQKEMAERLAAIPGTKNYGALSVRAQQVFNVKLLRKIPPKVFYPVPDVDSAFIQFIRNDPYPELEIRTTLGRVAKAAFANRRKKMFKPLAREFGDEQVSAALEKIGIDPGIRAEKLNVETFSNLAELLK